ncbi:DsbA family protein [Kutzneria kofuensis]|uniref:Protein-disulfide isomerase n=1 Tax=Kutzneria kofuensis TaxID=103725 RepID=A0A7W9NGW0_9PSEU|nr:thioredoxin domain-containing protein [Kutzneria kofuensis]MBB5891473.1 protein-disulfide isomerase [Kutzneria kofuensis]
MGAAQNNNKRDKSKANAARAVAAARGARNDRRNIAIGVAVVIVVAVVVIVGVILNTRQSDPAPAGADAIKVTKSSSEYTAKVGDDGTVIAGPDSAKTKIDVYEDFTCPYCGDLEQQSGAQMAKAMADGKLQVRYHLLNILDRNTNPPGYSLLAANAAIAAAKQGKFADFHASLYAQQPKEGGAGYTNEQLLSLGKRLGITAQQFTDDVNKGAYNDLVKQQVTTASAPPVNLQGTPTVLNGTTDLKALQDPQWLDKLLNS